MLYYLCLSEEDYDDVDSNTRHSEVDNEDDNDNKNDTPLVPCAFALKVLENEAAEIKQKEAWHDGDADNEVNDDDVVEKKNVKSSALENGSDDSLEVASEIIRKTKFIHPILLLNILNAKLETLITTCEVLIERTPINPFKIKIDLDLELLLYIDNPQDATTFICIKDDETFLSRK
mgnify:CR=1 FL=1